MSEGFGGKCFMDSLEIERIKYALGASMSDDKPKDQGSHYRFFFRKKITPTDIANGFVEFQCDPFRLQDILGIKCAVAFTVFKKAIRWGGAEAKDLKTDLKDIISACQRKLEMISEDNE